jgi:hypothetical protein
MNAKRPGARILGPRARRKRRPIEAAKRNANRAAAVGSSPEL